MIKMIWAQGKNGELGIDNRLPWHIPEDLRHFKETTSGSVVIMGGSTYRSLKGPLPDRTNIVLTRDPEPIWAPPHVLIYNSLPLLLNDLKTAAAYVIGGKELYDMFMPHAERLIVTHIDDEFEADTYAPKIDPDKWIVCKTEQSEYDKLSYITYKKDDKNEKLLL